MDLQIQNWLFILVPYEGESISHFLGRFRRANSLSCGGLGQATGLYSAIARWEKFRFNPPPSLKQLEKLSEIVQVEMATLQTMFPSAPMKMTPIRICSACYGENPYHQMSWQYKEIYRCDRHNLNILSECPNCAARFKFPNLWFEGFCHRCFTPFEQMPQS
ncbi:TniQ family protein [Geminocystis sp. NIES-3709]|uniref:TniQ family protein n=1 Tax=Geminocystis sp. NIES-3709 TaxID=1617448 RepID=UPI0005FCDC37|nr:TniQ family protein [Geminocystis sp. NIES-3709]BAQ63846.1 hypothetical protein GM3709_611 [Geminocystis sp. NIES-3709]